MGRLTLNILLVVRPVRARDDRRAHPRQVRRRAPEGEVDRRHAAARLRRRRPKLVVNEKEADLVRLIFNRFLRVGSADQAGAGTAARWAHDEILDDAGRQAPAGQADRQGCALQDPQQPRVPRRGGAQGTRRGTQHGPREGLGQGPRHPRRQRSPAQWHARADASIACAPALRARRARDDAVNRDNGRLAIPYDASTDAIRQGHAECPCGERAGGGNRRGGAAEGAALLAHACR